jgi:hypothetical protein
MVIQYSSAAINTDMNIMAAINTTRMNVMATVHVKLSLNFHVHVHVHSGHIRFSCGHFRQLF